MYDSSILLHGSYPFSPSLPRRGEREGGSTLCLSHLVEITPYGGPEGGWGSDGGLEYAGAGKYVLL
jgi:hypothetical protein